MNKSQNGRHIRQRLRSANGRRLADTHASARHNHPPMHNVSHHTSRASALAARSRKTATSRGQREPDPRRHIPNASCILSQTLIDDLRSLPNGSFMLCVRVDLYRQALAALKEKAVDLFRRELVRARLGRDHRDLYFHLQRFLFFVRSRRIIAVVLGRG